MTRSQYRILLIVGALLFGGVLLTQGYWFLRAYTLQEEQFDVSVNLAMRRTVHSLLVQQGDSSSAIPAVRAQEDATYAIDVPLAVAKHEVDSTLRAEFNAAGIDAAYNYYMYASDKDSIVFGNTVAAPGASMQIGTACTARDEPGPAAVLEVRFPGKDLYIAGSMPVWIAATAATLLILVFFTVALRAAFRERRYHEMKNDFIQNITHELKTPLSGITLAADMLKTANGSSAKYIAAIEGETARLESHVDRLLSGASIESGSIDLQKEPCRISDLVQSVVTGLQQQQPGRAIGISMENDATAALDVYHMTNALGNVVDNALRYSGPGADISIRVYSSGDTAIIEINDTGPGIPSAYRAQVFEKFFRVPNGNVHDVKGFGLGLYYTKHVVEAHNGSVELQSREGMGTAVTIALPLAKDAADA